MSVPVESENESRVAVDSTAANAQPGRPRLPADLAERYGLVVLFAAIVVFFSVWSKTTQFMTHANIVAILSGNMIAILVALAAMLPLTAHQFDLSPGAIAGASSITCAAAMGTYHQSLAVAIVLGIAMGVALGTINGVLVARYKLSSVITTLAMATALTGVMEWYTKGGTLTNGISPALTSFGSLNWLGIPRMVFLVVPVTAIIWYLLEKTPFGRYVRAISSNSRSARLVGLPVDRTTLSTFMIGGFLAGLAGVLLTANAGAADATTGPSYLFPALTAVFLGATMIRPGWPNTIGTVIGVFFVAVAVSGLTLAGANSWISDLFNGIVLFAAAGLSTIFARQRGGSRIF
jgi:ribose/xylose/arabinose/galactoside ABC-type transport system permease subunit